MLKKNQRLTTEAFDQFFKTGRRYHTPHLQLIYTPHPVFHGSVVVGKKVCKRAVDRNRWRRRAYNALYQLTKQTNQSGVYIVVLKPTAITLSFAALRQEIATVVGRTQ